MKVLLVGGAPISTWPELTEQFDYYIGIDRGSLFLLNQHLPLDAAIGDFDSLSHDELAVVSEKAKFIKQSPPEKDDTDTQLGLLHALELDQTAQITMIGLTGGRLDHFLANLWMVLEPRFQPFCMQLTIRDQSNTLRYFLPGEYTIKKEAEMHYLAYCCLTPMKNLTLRDSKYTLTNQQVDYPISYASNEFLTETASFSFEEGVLLVIQSKDS